ncbi:FxSxx-COOH system tetratricopeptide repeat protein [Streptomyces sp. H27-D2]|uniref:FxSxx-COOH system tetratricopeptide repeat protein n=1 Tax=Streptomyces sp. H27-D2 TaxID=3046304 RepID=UPI002DBC8473|nr:FxSxx-COOH system tetratricopeptide repeat protein [Streptomyces sp. H27-D2]MEC4018356.1 FxSxx-COOH system tetratricopeptide repeat protein [Streptomyces sp. H27-D2]
MTERPSVPERAETGPGAGEPGPAPARGRLPVADLCWWEVADALWLAEHHPLLASPERADEPPPSGGTPPEGSAAPPPYGRGGDQDGGERPPGGRGASDDGGADGSGADNGGADNGGTGEGGTDPSDLGDPGDEHRRPDGGGPPPRGSLGWDERLAYRPHVVLPAAEDEAGDERKERRKARPARAAPGAGAATGLDAAALGRALRPLRRQIRTARLQELDEDATAEQLAEDPRLPPVMRSGHEPRWDAVLLVDTGSQMAVWRGTANRFAHVLHRYGGFRTVELHSLDTDSETAEGVVLRGRGRGARAQPLRSLVDPTGRRIVFVLTDGLARAWRSGAMQQLLATWGRHQPLAVLHTLPQRLWHRTGLFPERVRLRTTGPWAANGQVEWEYTEPLLAEQPGQDGGRPPLPVPVLEIAADWIAPWARFVGGEGPRWAEVAAMLVAPSKHSEHAGHAGRPGHAAANGAADAAAEKADRAQRPMSAAERPISPAERVARFRVWSSSDAFALATRLAAVQLDLPVIASVQRHTLPRSGPAHLAEFLMSGLVEPLPGSEQNSYLFRHGVREELLASSTRQHTERASRKAAEILAPHSDAARDLLTHLDGRPPWREPEVTQDNLRFRVVERAVLQALSGSHLHRARQLEVLIEEYDEPVRVRVEDRAGSYENIDASTRNSMDSHSPVMSEGSGKVDYSATPGSRNDPEEAPVPSGQGGTQMTTVSQGTPAQGTPAQGTSQGAPMYLHEGAAVRDAAARAGTGSHGGAAPGEGAGVTLDRTERAPSMRPAVWGNMPPRNLVFTGREELLHQLERGLSEGPTAVLPHALHGMGGVGKSQLALEYVYRHAAQYDIVWWIPAERTTQIAQALVELAQRLHLPVSGEAITAVPAVLEALRTGTPYGNWLLVFDNAESPQAVQEYFPTGSGDTPIGSILVTSRNPQWNTLAHPLEVDVFEREESIHLLQRRNPDLPDAEADQLAQVLGDLPLAVEQASAWRAETGMPAAEYLRLFEEKRAELMTVSPPTQYEQTVATAWNVSLDHLERKNAAALQLLQVCAYFAPEPIARSLFSGAAVEPIAPDLDRALTDPLRLAKAIREINRYSLAKIDHRNNSIQMHRLVQAVLIARMSEEQRKKMRHGAHLLLTANTPRDPQDPEHWQRFGDLYPHVVVSDAVHAESRNVRQMVITVASYLFYWGDHEGARAFAQNAYDIWRERFGADDQQTMLLARQLRFVLWTMGRYDEAAVLGERMLAEAQRLGPEAEEELLAVMGQVAADRRAQGDFRSALALDEEVYERALRSYGDDDPETLLHAHNLGVGLRANGNFRRALELDQETWRRKVQMYGDQVFVTLITEMGLAIDRRELGDYALGAQLFEGITDKYRGLLGEMNPHTLRAATRLAVSRRKAGDHTGALELSRHARKTLGERYGRRSPDSLVASLNLSVDLRQTGDLNESLRLGEEASRLYQEVFGPNHPYTIAADVDLAITLRLLNKVGTARALNESALERAHQVLDETHPTALVCATNLASDMFAQGEAAGALELDERTLEATVRTLGEDHPSALALMSNIAADLRALRRLDEAEAMHARAVEGMKARLGVAHPAYEDAAAWRRANCDADPMPM